jgi:hypothetical protein
MNDSSRRAIQKIAIVVVALLVINFGYQIWRKMHPQVGGHPCDIQSTVTCNTKMNNGQAISLSVNPRPIQVEQDITATIRFTNLIPNLAQLRVYPVNATLQPQQVLPLTINNGVATVKFSVPSGVDAPRWVALVTFQVGTTATAVPFRFVVKATTPALEIW